MDKKITMLTPIQERMLDFLAHDPIVTRQFYLTGGTALSAYYLTHRDSEDLDFFSITEIDTLWLPVLAQSAKKTIKAASFTLEESFNRHLLYFHFPGNTLKTEFTYFPFPHIEPTLKRNGLAVDSLKDIAVNKLFTIYQKPASRHFIDLYCICKKTSWSLSSLTKLAQIKFETYIDPLQLAAQYLTADSMRDFPHMRTRLAPHMWVRWFAAQARALKSKAGTIS